MGFWRRLFLTRKERELRQQAAAARQRVLQDDLGHGVDPATLPWNRPPLTTRPERKTDWGSIYTSGAYLSGFLVFVGSWIYCIAHYGYLLGVGLGWLPSLIVGFLAGVLWPLIALALIALLLYSAV